MTESTDLATTKQQDFDAVIRDASEKLLALAETKDDDVKNQILTLAQLTTVEIKGVEGAGSRAQLAEIRMRQPMSGSDSIPADCKPGEFYNTDGDYLGKNVTFIPVLRHALRKKWSDENRIDCISLDGETGTRYGSCKECPYSKFEQGQAAECSPGHSFYVVTPELDGIYRVDFQKSSSKAGRNILRLTRPPALWGKSFVLSSSHHSGGGRNYYSLTTTPTGHKTSQDVMDVCEVLHNYFHAQYEAAKASLRRFNEDGESSDAPSVVISDGDDGDIDFGDTM